MRQTRHLCRHRGLSIPEVLISLAIIAILLTATAGAVDASFKAYRINQENATLTQNARVAMHRIVSTIRQSDAHAPADEDLMDAFADGDVVDDNGIAMIDDEGRELRYTWDSTNQRLMAEIDGNQYTLLTGVVNFMVTLEPKRSPQSIRTGASHDLLGRATLLLTIRSTAESMDNRETTGRQTVTLSTAVQPRRNTW
jgi:prepilin-type N-terminal cleavage/methylation domain-containing protein